MLTDLIDMNRHPITGQEFQENCKSELDEHGVLVLQGFLKDDVIRKVKLEDLAFHPRPAF